MHIILTTNLVIANTHPKSPSKKRLVVGLSGKKNGKFEEVKIPIGKKLKVLPIGVGIVTCSPPDVMPKSHHLNELKMSSLQPTSNVVSSIANKLAFTGKHKVQCSHNPYQMKKTKTQSNAKGAMAKVSVVKLSSKSMPNETNTKMKLKKKQKPTKGSNAAISMKVMQLIGLIPEL